MSTAQWILNIVLLAWVLTWNVGTRAVALRTFALPAVVVVAAAFAFLRDLPTAGNDPRLEIAGALIGLVLGGVSALLTRVERTAEGRLVVRAGLAFAALWVVVVAGRVAFAEWATHAGARSVGEFSVRHAITGADAWTAAFVLLALGMVLGRYLSTGLTVVRQARTTDTITSGGAA